MPSLITTTGTEIRLLIAWSAHKLALKDTLTLPNIYADVGPYLYGLSGYRNDVFSYQSRGVIDSNIILLARQDQTAAPRAVEKSLSQLPRAVPKPDEGEVFKVKERALERLLHRPRPDLSGVIYAREAFRTLVKAAFRRSQQETSYDDIARVVSPHYPMLVKGGFTYVTYYVLIMDTLRSLGAQSNGKNTWSLPSATTYPTEEDVELATRSTWRTESTLESPGILHVGVNSYPCSGLFKQLNNFSLRGVASEKEAHGCGIHVPLCCLSDFRTSRPTKEETKLRFRE